MKRLLRRLAVYGRRFGQVEIMDELARLRHEHAHHAAEQREVQARHQREVEDALRQIEALLTTLALRDQPPPSNTPS